MRRFNLEKVLKSAAVALIVMPVPFTTLPGILILCLFFAIYHKASLDKFGDLEDLIKRSLQNSEPVGFRRYLGTEQIVIHHRAKQAAVIPQNNSWFDNRKISVSTLHHTLKTSFPQYEAAQGSRRTSEFKVTASRDIKPAIEFHKLKTCL